MKISGISGKDVGKEIALSAKVKSMKRFPGAVEIMLEDDSGEISAVFSGLPEFSLGQAAEFSAIPRERNGSLILEIVSKAGKSFLIKSDKLDLMRPGFLKTREIILDAVSKNRTIVIRHHDDTDGYASGYVLELALLPLVSDKRFILTRSSSRAPYYDYVDAERDLNNFLGFRRHGEDAPLVILCDLGSNAQSMKSIKRLAMYGFEFIIIDHHLYDKENEEIAKAFLNPHTLGLGSDLNAGTLCSELAVMLGKRKEEILHLPALSGIADKSSGKELDSYIKLSGFEREYLEKWAMAIDHETYYLRFPEKSEILEDLFMPTKRNKEIVLMISALMDAEMQPVREAIKKFSLLQQYGEFKLIRVSRDIAGWDYASTKLPRIASDMYTGNRILFVETYDSISYRADYEKFNGVHLIAQLKTEFPYAFIDGGGHAAAGTIKFSPVSKQEIMRYILNYLDSLK